MNAAKADLVERLITLILQDRSRLSLGLELRNRTVERGDLAQSGIEAGHGGADIGIGIGAQALDAGGELIELLRELLAGIDRRALRNRILRSGRYRLPRADEIVERVRERAAAADLAEQALQLLQVIIRGRGGGGRAALLR